MEKKLFEHFFFRKDANILKAAVKNNLIEEELNNFRLYNFL